MCLYHQAPDEAAESINLSQSVSIATPEETVPEETVPEETEEEKNLPEWSEKVASGILTGEVTLGPFLLWHVSELSVKPGILLNRCVLAQMGPG